MDGTCDHVTYQKLVTRLLYGLVRCAVGVWPSHQRDDTVTAWAVVDGQRDTSTPSASSCKHIARAPVTNWEPQCVTLAGYCYAVGTGWKLQRYGVTVRGNVTSVYPPLTCKGIRTAELLDVAHTLQFQERDSSQTEIAGSVTRKLRIKKEDSRTLLTHTCLLKVGVEL